MDDGVILSVVGESHPDIADIYDTIGESYWSYHHHHYIIISIIIIIFIIIFFFIIITTIIINIISFSLGTTLSAMNDYDQAVTYYQLSLQIRLATVGTIVVFEWISALFDVH